jgi:hypothetical protein
MPSNNHLDSSLLRMERKDLLHLPLHEKFSWLPETTTQNHFDIF